MTDWIENSNNGEGPTPHSSILRQDYELLRAVAQERDVAPFSCRHAYRRHPIIVSCTNL